MTAPGRRLRADELQVWRSFLRAHASVIRRLESDLVTEQGLALAAYDVLVQLVEAPRRRLRMTELADLVLLSRSGLTRLVDRMEQEGLVTREPCDTDARGMFAVLTDAGYARLGRASRTHLRGVAEYVLDRLSADELAALGVAMDRVLEDPPAGDAVSRAG